MMSIRCLLTFTSFIYLSKTTSSFTFDNLTIPDSFLINFSPTNENTQVQAATAPQSVFKLKSKKYNFEKAVVEIVRTLAGTEKQCRKRQSYTDLNTLCNKIDDVKYNFEYCLGLQPYQKHAISYCKGRLDFFQGMITGGDQCDNIENLYCYTKIEICEMKIQCDDIFKKYMRYYYGNSKMKKANLITKEDEQVKNACVIIKPVVNPFNIFK